MTSQNNEHVLSEITEQLSKPKFLKGLFRQHQDEYPLHSGKVHEKVIQSLRSKLSPGCMGKSKVNVSTTNFQFGFDAERLQILLAEQIKSSICLHSDKKSVKRVFRASTPEHWKTSHLFLNNQ